MLPRRRGATLSPNSRKTYSLFDRDQRAEPPMGNARLTLQVTIEGRHTATGPGSFGSSQT
jgi:hypothetical protein